jgi:hypothetical protein
MKMIRVWNPVDAVMSLQRADILSVPLGHTDRQFLIADQQTARAA